MDLSNIMEKETHQQEEVTEGKEQEQEQEPLPDDYWLLYNDYDK